jgi:hypothetical protein
VTFRSKKMQIVSLVSKDGLMAKFNVSIPTHDLVDVMTWFYSFWLYQRGTVYASDMYANWLSYYEVNMTRVLSPNGNCYTFNFPGASQFFQLEKYENFQLFIVVCSPFSVFRVTLHTRKSFDCIKLSSIDQTTPSG